MSQKTADKPHFQDSCYDIHEGVELRFKYFSREIPS